MAEKKIVWSLKAIHDKIDVLEYWIDRTKSKTFSIKLDILIDKALQQICQYPDSGKTTDYGTRLVFLNRLKVENPVGLIEFFLQLPELVILFQMTNLPFQGQFFLSMEKEQFFHKLASEGLPQRCDMKQEVSLAPGGFPVTIRLQATGGDDTVDMRVI